MINLKEHEFPISVVAALFFDQTAQWFRYKERTGILTTEEGQIIGRRKNDRGDRVYTLTDVREAAHAMFRHGTIDLTGFKHCIARLDAMDKAVYRRKRIR